MESIVKNNLLDFAQSCKILYTNQHGFTSDKSTSTQLLECLYKWNYAYESKYKTDVTYIDFRKVFDTVPHNLLRNKLLQYNYCLPTVNWITQFLVNRTQYVYVNGSKSSIAAVSTDITQGSILGPALFVFLCQ